MSSPHKPKIFIFSTLFLISQSISTSTINYDTTHETITSSSGTIPDDEVMNIYESWLVENNKNYNILGEKEKRFQIFKDNFNFINQWNNNESSSYKLGLNKFADLSNDEFRVMYSGLKQKPVLVETDVNDLPVNEEGQYEDDETVLQMPLANSLLSVATEPSCRHFQFYKSGVFSGSCGMSLDNDFIVIGDGTTEDGKDYWIVKNSWGTDWGENGYLKVVKGIAIKSSDPTETTQNPPNQAPSLSSRRNEPEVACDSYNSCPSRNTCCCVHTYGPYCFAWGCCKHEFAVCYEDQSHCCPRDQPIYDSSSNTCSKSKNSPLSVKALKRTPACKAN